MYSFTHSFIQQLMRLCYVSAAMYSAMYSSNCLDTAPNKEIKSFPHGIYILKEKGRQ